MFSREIGVSFEQPAHYGIRFVLQHRSDCGEREKCASGTVWSGKLSARCA
jgi:hypothetical protein